MRAPLPLTLSLILLLALTACTGAPEEAPRSSAPASAAATVAPVASMVALGDSLTLGLNACGTPSPCSEASWSTGESLEVDSIASRLEAATGVRPETQNLAKSGVKITQMGGQVAAAIAAAPDLITVLVGANDACARSLDGMTPADEFGRAARSGLAELSDALPDTTIYLSSVPDLPRLRDATSATSEGRSGLAANTACATVTGPEASTDAVQQRIEEYNSALENACGDHFRCVWDDEALYDFVPDAEDISTVDYFHISAKGQAAVAELAWGVLEKALAR